MLQTPTEWEKAFANHVFDKEFILMGKSTWAMLNIIRRSVQLSGLVMSDSMREWITARQTFLSNTNSRSSLRLTFIESVMPSSYLILSLILVPFSSCPQSLPASESFLMSQLFTWGGQVDSPKFCILNHYTLLTPTLSVVLTTKPQSGIIILILQETGDWNCGNFSKPNPVS